MWKTRKTRFSWFTKEDEAREEMHDVMELAAKFFETTLATRAGAKTRGYLADRELSEQVVKGSKMQPQ